MINALITWWSGNLPGHHTDVLWNDTVGLVMSEICKTVSWVWSLDLFVVLVKSMQWICSIFQRSTVRLKGLNYKDRTSWETSEDRTSWRANLVENKPHEEQTSWRTNLVKNEPRGKLAKDEPRGRFVGAWRRFVGILIRQDDIMMLEEVKVLVHLTMSSPCRPN